jgi:4-hydroxy-tetrahydrodipicolinate reductase
MLANAVNSQFNDSYVYEYDRHSKRLKRPKKEIGIHSIRGGTIVGEHDVIFAGRDEVITLSHHAASREVFATGAVKAALFLADKPAGLYDMSDVVKMD